MRDVRQLPLPRAEVLTFSEAVVQDQETMLKAGRVPYVGVSETTYWLDAKWRPHQMDDTDLRGQPRTPTTRTHHRDVRMCIDGILSARWKLVATTKRYPLRRMAAVRISR